MRKDLIGSADFYRHDRNPQFLHHDAQPLLKGLHSAVPGMPSLREDQNVKAGIGELSHVFKRAAEPL